MQANKQQPSKYLILLVLALLLASFPGCGLLENIWSKNVENISEFINGDNEQKDTLLNPDDATEGESRQDPDSVPSGNHDSDKTEQDDDMNLDDQLDELDRNNLTQEQMDDLAEIAEKEDVDVSWDVDGSIRMDDGESEFSTSGNWPDNDFTNLLPAPTSGTIIASDLTTSDCTIVLTWTIDDAREYVAKVKREGFTQDVQEDDWAEYDVYSYTASNSRGYKVSVAYVMDAGSIIISFE